MLLALIMRKKFLMIHEKFLIDSFSHPQLRRSLKNLQKYGLVSYFHKEKHQHFVAEDPTALGNILKHKQPEHVFISGKQIKILSDWEIEEEIKVGK